MSMFRRKKAKSEASPGTPDGADAETQSAAPISGPGADTSRNTQCNAIHVWILPAEARPPAGRAAVSRGGSSGSAANARPGGGDGRRFCQRLPP